MHAHITTMIGLHLSGGITCLHNRMNHVHFGNHYNLDNHSVVKTTNLFCS